MGRAVMLLVSLFVAAHLGSAAYADLPPGAIAPELNAAEWINADQPVKLADLKGMVVVLYFWVSFHEGGQQALGLISSIESHPAIGRKQGVFVIGLTDADRKRTQQTLDQEKIFFPVGVGSTSYKDYQISAFPGVTVIDPRGKVAYCGVLSNADEFVKKVQEVLGKSPPTRTHPKEAVQAEKHLAAARDAMKADNVRGAIRAARDVLDHALRGDPLRRAARQWLDLADAIGRDRLAGAEASADGGKYADAVRELKKVSREFAGVPAGARAAERIGALGKAHPEVAELLKGDERENKARSKLLEAQEALRARDFATAYADLQGVIKDFDKTESAEAARRIAERMKKNTAVWSLVRDGVAAKDCEGWLSQARAFIASRKFDKAKELLERILSQYPDTRFAEEARKELAKIK